ncbi:MAG: hypothetical protein ACKVH8_02415 [Pirellulales bacterium]
MQFVSDKHGLEVRMNNRALDEVGLSSDTPITLNLKGVSLRSALRLILAELDLTYHIDHGALVITTLEESETRIFAKFYKLEPLLKNREVSLAELSAHIRSLIDPESWAEVGGYATLVPRGRGIAVQQTSQNHREVVQFLTTYGQLLKPHQSPVVDIIPVRNPRMQATLDQKLDTVEFFDTPLLEALEFLQQVLDIPIQLDQRALDDIGLSADEPVSIKLAKGHTARYVMNTILKPHDLIVLEHQGVLFVTTREVNETMLSLRAYSMNGLTTTVNEESGRSLVDLVSTSVHADSWDELGGPGQIAEDRATNSLFVLQTQETHAAIAGLLDQMRPEGTFESSKKATDKPIKLLSTKPNGKSDPFGGESDDSDPFAGESDSHNPFGSSNEPKEGDANDDPFGDDPFASDEEDELFYEVEVLLDREDSEEEQYGEDDAGDAGADAKQKKRRTKVAEKKNKVEELGGLGYGDEESGFAGGAYGGGGRLGKSTQDVRVLFLYDTNPLMGFMQVTDPKTLDGLEDLVNEIVLSNSPGVFRHHNGRIIIQGPKSSADKVEAFLKKLKYEPSPQFKQMQGYPGGYGGGGMGGGAQGGGGGFFNVAD